MKKIDFGFIQGRMTSPPSKKMLQYFPKKNWKKEFYLAKKYKFDFIEYFGERKFNKSNPIWNYKKLKEISNLVKKCNLINYSFCDDFFINNNFNSYKNFENYYDLIVNNLSIINIKIYVLALFEKSKITKNNLEKFTSRLRVISEKLKKKNIKLALETNLDFQSIQKLIKITNAKNIFVVYDTGNRLKKNNFQYNDIIKLRKHICHFHIKDKNWNGENLVLGKGCVNFEKIFKAIKKIKYKGKYTFETNRGNDPVITMKNNKEFIKKIIKKINYR